MKAPNIIKYNSEYWFKKIIPYKYKTKNGLYGYKGYYLNYNTGEERHLVEIVELAKWQVENSLLNYLKCRNIENVT